MRRLTVEVEGGTPEQQADCLRRLAWTVGKASENLLPTDSEAVTPANVGFMKSVRCVISLVEMADYDHKLLADAWYSGTGSASRSVNALARATDIDIERLRHILLGEKQATVKELNAICEELAVSVESVKDTEN